MALEIQELLSTLPADMRSASDRWRHLEDGDRRRCMREYLEAQAASVGLEVEDLVFVALTGRSRSTAAGQGFDGQPPRAAPDSGASAGPAGEASGRGGGLSDHAFYVLAEGLGISLQRDDGGVRAVDEVETAFAREGVKRAEISADSLALALGLLAKGVASHSEEQLRDPNGLPQALETVFQNRKAEPVAKVREFLAGGVDASYLEGYIEEYFHPFVQVSRRLQQLCERLKRVAEELSPRVLEGVAPKSVLGGVDHKALWKRYCDRHQQHAEAGFGGSLEKTRAWLLDRWLN